MAVNISRCKLKNYWPIYILVAIPLALVLTFNYFPIFNGFVHIFYRWDGDMSRNLSVCRIFINSLTTLIYGGLSLSSGFLSWQICSK